MDQIDKGMSVLPAAGHAMCLASSQLHPDLKISVMVEVLLRLYQMEAID